MALYEVSYRWYRTIQQEHDKTFAALGSKLKINQLHRDNCVLSFSTSYCYIPEKLRHPSLLVRFYTGTCAISRFHRESYHIADYHQTALKQNDPTEVIALK